MSLRITCAGLLMLALLGGCQTRNDVDTCIPLTPSPGAGFLPEQIAVPYALYIIGCKTATVVGSALDEKEWTTIGPSGRVVNDQYRSADGVFSVMLPGPLASIGHPGYRVDEQYLPHDDYVFFASTRTGTLTYGIKVTPQLDREYAALGMAEYADLSMQDARMQIQRHSGASLDQLHQENLRLAGKPALFRVYRQTAKVEHGTEVTIYYLVYFIKQDNRAAILSVLWPKACPQCEHGNEQSIRDMDPGLQRFIGSFEMGTN